MKNWSIDENKFKTLSPKEYEIWRMSQLINYGTDGEKISYKRLVKLLPQLDIDDEMRTLLTWYINEQNKSKTSNKRTN